jgi:hypothetical protein
MLKARISGQLRSRGHLHPAGVCQRPKLLELFKQLGGEFKFVTGKPYQTVFSTNMIGFAEAAYQCENYYNEQKKKKTQPVSKSRKLSEPVKLKRSFRRGKTIHREAGYSHSFRVLRHRPPL